MLAATAYGHAGLIIPTTRNSIDRLAEGFSVDGSALGTPCTCAVSTSVVAMIRRCVGWEVPCTLR